MNAERRKQIEKASALLEDAKQILETVAQEERDYFDNMPENMQSGEKGWKADDAAETLAEAAEACAEIVGNIEQAGE